MHRRIGWPPGCRLHQQQQCGDFPRWTLIRVLCFRNALISLWRLCLLGYTKNKKTRPGFATSFGFAFLLLALRCTYFTMDLKIVKHKKERSSHAHTTHSSLAASFQFYLAQPRSGWLLFIQASNHRGPLCRKSILFEKSASYAAIACASQLFSFFFPSLEPRKTHPFTQSHGGRRQFSLSFVNRPNWFP